MKINSLFDNVEEVEIDSFLVKCGVSNPHHYLSGQIVEPYTNYDNIEEYVKEIIEWIKDNNTIHQISDSDFDGCASSSMLYSYLKLIKPNLNIITHYHSKKEHGISKDILDKLKDCSSSLLLIPDAGVNDVKECKILSELGWKIHIFDHHHSEKDNPYAKIINNQTSKNVVNKGLCGTGVTFKVMQAIDNQLGVSYSKQFISYVWLANIGDSVPFTYSEQYTFTKWGRRHIHKNLKPFIDEWCEGKLDNKTIAWRLVPKFNSLIRLGTLEDKQELFKALCGEVDPSNIIDKCKKYHTQQQTQSKKMVEDVEIINNSKILIGRLHDKTTMTGLIAGKLMSKYNKPILLGYENIDSGEFSGSVRSPIDLKDTLAESGLTSFQAGHNRSCGFGYPLSNEQAIIEYLDSVLVDCEPHICVLTSSTIGSLPNNLFSFIEDYKHIFGKDLDCYCVHIKPFTIYNTDIKVLGKGGTIKFTKNNLDFISFFTSNDMKEQLYMNVNERVKLNVECVVELCYNEFRGKRSKQAVIQKIECNKIDDEVLDFDSIFGC